MAIEFNDKELGTATMATGATDDLLNLYKDYEDEIEQLSQKRREAAPSVAKPDDPTTHPLWGELNSLDEDYTTLWPTQPGNAVGVMLVSKIIGCPVKKLPGPDFEMPVFEQDSWSTEVAQHIPDSTDLDIVNYVAPIEATYWFCYGLRLNKPSFLSGVKGCGKSALPKFIAAMLQWPFLRKQMAKDLDSSEFFGQWVADEGSTKFIPGDLPQAAEAGMILLLDEISNAPPELHPALHQALEKGGKIYLNSEAGNIENKIVVPGDTFRVVATDNTRGQGDSRGHYAGTDVMNSATMDRFRVMVMMDYMDKKAEIKVLKNTVPGVNDKLAGLMVDVATRVRASYAAGDLSETLSMRPLIEWAEKTVWTRNILRSLQTTFINKIESASERSEVESHVQAVFGSLAK
jgi:MoxR-like ATPase